MIIVLIEDDDQKAERISETLQRSGRPSCVALFASYQSGLKRILSGERVDLIILDMSLPTFDPSPDSRPGRPRPLGGYDLMRKMKRRGLRIPVVILTALENFGSVTRPITFLDLKERCREEFPDLYRGAIYYSQSKSGWMTELDDIVRGLNEQDSSR